MTSLRKLALVLLLTLLSPLSFADNAAFDCGALDLSRPNPQLTRRTVAFSDLQSLRVMTFNLKDFFVPKTSNHDRIIGEKLKKTEKRLKTPYKIEGVAKVISQNSPDIIVLQEIENLSATLTLNHLLGDAYIPVHKEGNDVLDIAFLIRKDLPFFFKLETNTQHIYTDNPLSGPVPLFTRDLPILTFRATHNGPPILVLMGHHGKSMRDSPGDKYSVKLRTAQVEKISEIVDGYLEKYGSDLPVLIAGDFNTDLRSGHELAKLWKHFRDTMDLLPKPVPDDHRTTFVFFHGRERNFNQLDGVLASEAFDGHVLDAFVARFYDDQGRRIGLPRRVSHKIKSPSDHFPAIAEISMAPLLKRLAK